MWRSADISPILEDYGDSLPVTSGFSLQAWKLTATERVKCAAQFWIQYHTKRDKSHECWFYPYFVGKEYRILFISYQCATTQRILHLRSAQTKSGFDRLRCFLTWDLNVGLNFCTLIQSSLHHFPTKATNKPWELHPTYNPDSQQMILLSDPTPLFCVPTQLCNNTRHCPTFSVASWTCSINCPALSRRRRSKYMMSLLDNSPLNRRLRVIAQFGLFTVSSVVSFIFYLPSSTYLPDHHQANDEPPTNKATLASQIKSVKLHNPLQHKPNFSLEAIQSSESETKPPQI